jgi:PAS domain S-box-containing protein
MAQAIVGQEDRPIRVIVAEDEEPLRAALADLIGRQPGIEIVGTAAHADAAIELARALKPDVALLDMRMPGGGGSRAAMEICAVSPETRSIALSAYEERSSVFEVLRAGAVSYIVKGAAPTEIIDAIRRAVRNQSSLSTRLVADLVGDVSRDAAERDEADEVVRHNEARFRRLLESTPDGVVMVEANGNILLVNEQTERLFGYTRQELLGQPIEMLVPPRFRESHAAHRAGYFSAPRTRPMGIGLELAGMRKDESEFPIDISLSAAETDEGYAATAFIRDLTERRASDAMLRKNAKHFEALLESAPDAVVIVDAGGRIFFANQQTETLFGYDRSELLDRPIEVLIPERFHAHHLALRDGYLADPRPRPIGAGLELAGRRKSGIEFPVDISLSGIETSDGRLVAAFVRDATDRKARADLEQGIAARRAVLTHLVSAGEEERGRIAADIHDDSIQVVTAAAIRLQILRESLDDPTQLLLLDQLGETIQHAISRLRHLLFELRPPALDHEGLGPALRMYLDVADEQTDTVYHLDDRLTSQPAEATRVILYRIAQEVLTNVRNHAGADNATVTLSEREDGYYVRVVDDGIGFAPEAAANRPGHMGIAAIRERAELAGGWLRVASTPGEGTTVEFWIAPGVEAEPSENGRPEPTGARR